MIKLMMPRFTINSEPETIGKNMKDFLGNQSLTFFFFCSVPTSHTQKNVQVLPLRTVCRRITLSYSRLDFLC